MTDRKVDNPPVLPLGRSPQVGQTYIDTVTGQFKQVQQSGPDIVIPVIMQDGEPTSGGIRRTPVPEPASLDEAKAQYNNLNKELARVNSLLTKAAAGGAEGGVVRDGGVSYTLDSLRAQSKDLEMQVSDAKKFVDSLGKSEKPIRDAEKEIKKINDRLTFEPDPDEVKAGAKPPSAAERKRLTTRKTELERIVNQTKTKEKTGSATTAGRGPTVSAPATTASEVDASTGVLKQSPDFGPGMRARPEDQFGMAAPATGGTGGGTGGGGRPQNPKRGQEWTGPKGVTWRWDGTKWNRKKGTGQEETGAPTNPMAGVDVERLKRDYPGYSWIWELGQEFADTQKLWADYLNGDITVERFNNLIGQSSWYTDQRTGNETRRIKNRYGDILDGGTLSKLVSESIKFGYEDDELDTAFFNSALAKNVITGEYIDSKAAKIALSSNLANNYRNFAKSMFLSADDQEIEDLLIGKSTEEDFYRNKRSIAKSVYTNWASLLDDPTMTMDKIVKPWKDMAAQVLEMDPNQIDMTKPQYQVAYAGSPDGKMGAMSLGEWYTKLRSDNTYGWNKTTGAKQEARELAYNLAKTFGKA